MRRDQLEHAIRASTEIIRQDAVIIIGSQAILGSWDEDELPEETTMSIEVDVCPLDDNDAQDLATELDSIIGEWSPFHETHGFYIQGVGRQTAVLPEGWVGRLVTVSNDNTRGRTGLCLEPHDLCAAKILVLREKDKVFVRALIDSGLVDETIVLARLRTIGDPRSEMAQSWIQNRPKGRNLGSTPS